MKNVVLTQNIWQLSMTRDGCVLTCALGVAVGDPYVCCCLAKWGDDGREGKTSVDSTASQLRLVGAGQVRQQGQIRSSLMACLFLGLPL